MTLCAKCDSDVGYEADKDILVTCSRCVQRQCRRAEYGDEAELASLDPEVCRAARQAHGWTQVDLALKLRLPVRRVSEFERGLTLPTRELYDWVSGESK